MADHIESAPSSQAVSTEIEFIKPHYIEALGEEGLTAKEIAISLKVRSNNVRRRIERTFIEHCKLSHSWRVAQFCAANDSNDLPISEYAMNTDAAKAFIATYRNEIGVAYLEYLFNCERFAQNAPVILSKMKALEDKCKSLLDEVALMREEKQKRIIKRLKSGQSTILAPVEYVGIFGQIERKYVRQAIADLDKVPLKEAIVKHCLGILTGVTKKLTSEMKELEDARLERDQKRYDAVKSLNESMQLKKREIFAKPMSKQPDQSQRN
jgi:hypothetical protein